MFIILGMPNKRNYANELEFPNSIDKKISLNWIEENEAHDSINNNRVMKILNFMCDMAMQNDSPQSATFRINWNSDINLSFRL